MMHSPLVALLWERWRRTRWAVAAAVLAPAIGWFIRAMGYDTVGGGIAVIFSVMGIHLLVVVLLFAQCEMENLNLGFPKRLFRFPVRTVTLIAVYMGYGVAAMALPCLVAFAAAKVFDDSLENWWITFLVLETIFVWIQTLGWLNGARAVFYFIIPTLAAACVLLYLAAKFDMDLEANILCPAIIAMCCGMCYWNVSADRRGAWISGWRWLGYLSSLFRRKRTRGFASALRAQAWFEYRQIGHLVPIAALALLGPVLAAKIVGLILSDEAPQPALASKEDISALMTMTVLAIWSAGLFTYAVYHRDRKSGACSFWLRRPVATGTLALARLGAAARSLAKTLAIIMLITLALLAWDLVTGAQSGVAGFVPQVLEDRSWLPVSVAALLALSGFMIACWTSMKLAWASLYVTIALELAFGLVWVCCGGDFLRVIDFLESDFVRWCACIAAVALVMGTAWAFCAASRRELIDGRVLISAACLFPVAAVSLWALLVWIGAGGGWPGPMEGAYTLGAAALPFIPLAAASLSIAKQRHC